MKKHRLLRTSLVAGAGAAAMYFADPENGPVRRALLRQRLELFAQRTEDTMINEPLETAEAMLDLRDVAGAVGVGAETVEPIERIEPVGPPTDLPKRAPISDETMTVDEATFHAARLR